MTKITENKNGGELKEGDSDYDSEDEKLAEDVQEEDEINFDLLEVTNFDNEYHKALLKQIEKFSKIVDCELTYVWAEDKAVEEAEK